MTALNLVEKLLEPRIRFPAGIWTPLPGKGLVWQISRVMNTLEETSEFVYLPTHRLTQKTTTKHSHK